MEQRIKDNLAELQKHKDAGCFFFTFSNEPNGICLHVKDEQTGIDVFMRHLTITEAKQIIIADNDSLPGVIVVRPGSQLHTLFKRKTGRK